MQTLRTEIIKLNFTRQKGFNDMEEIDRTFTMIQRDSKIENFGFTINFFKKEFVKGKKGCIKSFPIPYKSGSILEYDYYLGETVNNMFYFKNLEFEIVKYYFN